jgi:hypothetical protein
MFAATHAIANARALMRPNSAPRTTTPRSRGEDEDDGWAR